MNKRARLLAPLLLGTLILAQVLASHGKQSAWPPTDIDRLAALIQDGSFHKADKLAASLLADPVLDARAQAVCGLAVLKAGRIQEAEAIFNKVIARSPKNPEAHLGLGRIARIRNDPDTAISHFRRSVSSAAFGEEALRQLWRLTWDRGWVSELREVRDLVIAHYGRESEPLPSWIANALGQIRGLKGERLFQMEGNFEHLRLPLIADPDPRIRMRRLAMRLNGKGEYLFDIDSASADFMTVSPLLADELGLTTTGSSTATGVGTATAAVRFSMVDLVEFGGIAFRNVPVFVSDLHTFRGAKKGLIGTALLKRFNVTIDTAAGVVDLFPLERPDLLSGRIDRTAVAADVPLYLFDATTVEASLAGAPPALYILDSAAATNLVDGPFFEAHLKPKLDPARIVRGGIQGAQGVQWVNHVDGLPIRLGPLDFDGQTVHEFPMETLNTISGRYAAGLLGNPLLWPYRVHMDFRAGRLILERFPQASD